MKSPPFSIFTLLLALVGWTAVAGGAEQDRPLEKFRPQWQIGRQWMVETESRQPQLAPPQRQHAAARWHFAIEAIDQLEEKPCWRLVVRVAQGDQLLDEPRTTIWIDQSAATIRQIETQLPTSQGYRSMTESYSSSLQPAPVIGFSSLLPIALPQFPVQGEKAIEAFEYKVASGAAGVKGVQEIGFVTSVRQELLEPSQEGLKSIFGESEVMQSENQSLLEVKLTTPQQTVQQIWREGSPWPLYADNGVTTMRLVETPPDQQPRGAEPGVEPREAALPDTEGRRTERPGEVPGEETSEDRPRSELRPDDESKSLAVAGGVEKASARITPWSGYWWPMREGRLLVPLTKYDRLTQRQAAEWERLHFPPGPDVPAWHGYCHAWAAASILEAEPNRTRTSPTATVHIPLDIGDQKGLLTACHTEDLANTWGERTEAGDEIDERADFPPDLLWRLLRLHVGEAGVPLILDIEPGPEVWNYPVYHYEVRYRPLDENGRHQAEMTLLMADNSVPPAYQGTKIRKQTYRFTIEIRNGKLVMGSGRWTGPSLKDHPDFAWYPYQAVPTNPEVCHHQVRQLVSADPVTPSPSPASSPTERPEVTDPVERPSGPAEDAPRREPLIMSPGELASLIANQTSSFPFDATVDRFDGASYHPGENYFLRVTSDQPGYFYLLQVDHTGVPALLYPTAGEDNRIPGGRTVEIRPAGVAEGFPVVGPAGTLRLKSIVTSRPLAFSGLLEPLPSADANRPQQHAGLPVPFRWHPTQRQQVRQLLSIQQQDESDTRPTLPPREILGPFAQDLTVIYVDTQSQRNEK